MGASLENLLRDVLHGFRAMRRLPGFSLVVVLTLALGIGVNTAIFSVFHFCHRHPDHGMIR